MNSPSIGHLLWQTLTWKTLGWSSKNLMEKINVSNLHTERKSPWSFPRLYDITYTSSGPLTNRMKQWTDIIESLMSLGNTYYTFKSLFEQRSDSVKGHLALDMKQPARETEYFKEYWRAKFYHLWDNLPGGSVMLPEMLKHAGEKFEQTSCDLMTSESWEHDAVGFLNCPMMLSWDARLWKA